jgi:hypothetical protein
VSTIPRPGPGRYILVYPTPDGIEVQVWQGQVQVSETKLAGMEIPASISDSDYDAAIWRLIDAMKAA